MEKLLVLTSIKTENIIGSIIGLLAGLGMLLIGFKLLSENLEKLATGGLKKMFSKTSKNPLIGVGIGALATAIIQSSSATTVMIVGFVNSGAMNLFQATAMIMGANIGTTITAQIAQLESLSGVSETLKFMDYVLSFIMALTCVGIFMHMLSKKDKTKSSGLAMAGLGLVFIALNYMSDAMSIFKGIDEVKDFLSACTNPILLLLFGAAFTAIIQSSSAISSLLIVMASAGLVIGGENGGNAVLFVILGSNIGTTITATLSALGASTNAKRASLIHFLFNFLGSIIFFVILLVYKDFMNDTFAKWFKNNPATQIAMFHTFFNVLCTIIFLPMSKVFVKISEIVIKDKKKVTKTAFIDDRLLKTPSVAIFQASKETLRIGKMSMETLSLSIDSFVNKTLKNEEEIKQNIFDLEELNQNILSYLVKISSLDVSDNDEKYLSTLHNVVNDFYREVEIADNMLKYTRHTLDQSLTFSSSVIQQINVLKSKLNEQFELVSKIFETRNKDLINQIDEIEQQIDTMRTEMINAHIARLERNECSPASSGVFINLVSNLERAGDHLNYIAHTLIN